jgi:hypothetical protein
MEFSFIHEIKLGAKNGAYSKVTQREYQDSQITVSSEEASFLLAFFGREEIHVGNVKSDRVKANKKFKLYPTGKEISLNLVFPKPKKNELRLYLSERAGFKPLSNDIWFMFEKDNVLWIGSLSEDEWSELESKIDQRLAQPIADKPAKNDLLGRSPLIHVLKGVIDRNENRHFIVALFARWGSGKSSVIELLKNKFSEDDGTSFIQFNAWQNSHSLSLAASVANTIIDELYGKRSIVDRIFLSVSRALWKDRGLYGFIIFLGLCLGVLYFSFDAVESLLNKNKVMSISAMTIMILGLPVKTYLDHPFTNKLKELAKKKDFTDKIGLMGDIRGNLKELFSLYPPSFKTVISAPFKKNGNNQKYLLVIDDLDRCSDEKIVEMLEVIQLLIDIDNVSVLLAVDQDVLLKAVASGYRRQRVGINDEQALAMARDFLGKIFQLTLSLEYPTKKSKAHFVRERLYKNTLELNYVDDEILSVKEGDTSTNELDLSDSDLGSIEYVESDEYLADSKFEYDFFIEFAISFNVSNPRSMIRMHNSITLLKGLHPELIDNKKDLKVYIFFVFWFDYYGSCSESDRTILRNILKGESYGSKASRWVPINEVWSNIKPDEKAKQDLNLIKYRVENVTLPYLEVVNLLAGND